MVHRPVQNHAVHGPVRSPESRFYSYPFKDGTRVFSTQTETATESMEHSDNKSADDDETIQDVSTEKNSPSMAYRCREMSLVFSLTEKDHMTLHG